jgi:hypothetical protein
MQTYTLSRTGDVPLKFEGDELAFITTRPDDPGRFARWYEAAIYRTRGGTFVLFIAYRTNRGEPSVERAILCDSPEAVRAELTRYDPLEHLAGFPPGEAYAEKQARLERTLRLDWQTAVRDLFEGIEEEFSETIP